MRRMMRSRNVLRGVLLVTALTGGTALGQTPPAGLAPGRAGAERGQPLAVATDPTTGIRIGIPATLTQRGPGPGGGTRLQSADGRVTLDLRALGGSSDDLRAMFARYLADVPGRTIVSRFSRDDGFGVAGETAGGRFHVRFAQKGSSIRGYTLSYDKAGAAAGQALATALAASFEPFPEGSEDRSGPGIAASGAPPTRPSGGEARGGPAAPPGPSAASGPAATGVVLSPRLVVAPAGAVATCRATPLVDGAPARPVRQDGAFVLLEPATPHRTAPIRLAPAGTAPDETGSALFIGDGGRALVVPVTVRPEGRIEAALQDGALGAAVLDRAGRLLGLVDAPALGRRSVAGIVPPASHGFRPATELVALLGRDAPPPGPDNATATGTAAAAAFAPALARIGCGSTVAPPRPATP